MCRSTNRQLEPEVWFRIVNIAQDGRDASHDAVSREQTIEIALGPKGAFENDNISALTRRVAADQLGSHIPPRQGKPKPSTEPKTPRVVELLRKAIEWKALLESGEIANQAQIARRVGVTRARVTQVMAMLRLAPEIKRQILSMPSTIRRPPLTERSLRPIVSTQNRRDRLWEFRKHLNMGTLSP